MKPFILKGLRMVRRKYKQVFDLLIYEQSQILTFN
jgi:hypothetical protein